MPHGILRARKAPSRQRHSTVNVRQSLPILRRHILRWHTSWPRLSRNRARQVHLPTRGHRHRHIRCQVVHRRTLAAFSRTAVSHRRNPLHHSLESNSQNLAHHLRQSVHCRLLLKTVQTHSAFSHHTLLPPLGSTSVRRSTVPRHHSHRPSSPRVSTACNQDNRA